MRRFLVVVIVGVLTVGLLTGCGGAVQQYILSEPQTAIKASHRRVRQIGVDRVVVPAYLAGNKIPVQSAKGELTYCDTAVWATAPEKGITRHLITYLQKRFATPHVYRYPWDIEKSTGVRLKVILNRFLYVESRKAVVLEASFFVEPISGHGRRARLFMTSIPVPKGETPLIVVAMNRAIDRLAEASAQMIEQ